MDQTVSVFGVVYLWVDAQTFMSFPVEIVMLTPIDDDCFDAVLCRGQ